MVNISVKMLYLLFSHFVLIISMLLLFAASILLDVLSLIVLIDDVELLIVFYFSVNWLILVCGKFHQILMQWNIQN
jgi:hypothetical protein